MTIILKVKKKHINGNDDEFKNNLNGDFKMYSRFKFDRFLPRTLLIGVYL